MKEKKPEIEQKMATRHEEVYEASFKDDPKISLVDALLAANEKAIDIYYEVFDEIYSEVYSTYYDDYKKDIDSFRKASSDILINGYDPNNESNEIND
jgi:hypothetical protein